MVKLIKAGFHKERTILAVFLIINVISSFILHSGIFASIYPKLYDEYSDELGLADAYIYTDADHDAIDGVLAENEDIDSYIVQDMINLENIKITTSRNSKEKTADWYIQRFGDNVGCNEAFFEKLDNSIEGRRIYINTYTASVYEWDLGDKIYIETALGNQKISYNRTAAEYDEQQTVYDR